MSKCGNARFFIPIFSSKLPLREYEGTSIIYILIYPIRGHFKYLTICDMSLFTDEVCSSFW